jgi:hypothetical protein
VPHAVGEPGEGCPFHCYLAPWLDRTNPRPVARSWRAVRAALDDREQHGRRRRPLGRRHHALASWIGLLPGVAAFPRLVADAVGGDARTIDGVSAGRARGA